ncbi:nitronate monooxygenase [Nocardioidaceae bacterium]|nr:nitronate monooxygenase [Nocardioidaceae bacterium]
MIRTEFTEMFGVEHPIACGGMTAVGTAELIAGVANAGALGFLTALTPGSPEALVKEIAKTRDLTDKPFGINLTILPSIDPIPYDEYRQVIAESGVGVVETAGSNPAPHLPTFKEAGIKVVHKATTVRHALKAQSIGVDVVSIDGFECAGHPGNDDVPGLVLIPAAAAALDIPVIASGGLGNGAGLVAALALGAVGINMGTRFVATAEAPVHENMKRQIVENDETDTVIVFRSFGNTARVAKNSISMEIAEIGAREDSTFDDVAHLASGKRAREAVIDGGDMEGGMWWASQAQGVIDSVGTCAEVVDEIMADAERIISERLSSALT